MAMLPQKDLFDSFNLALLVECSYPSRPLLKIITLDEPDANLWLDFKVRKPPEAS